MIRPTLRKAGANNSEFAYFVKEAAFKPYVDKVSRWDDVEQRRLHDQRFATQEFRIIGLDGSDVGIMALSVLPDCVKLHQLFLVPQHLGAEGGDRYVEATRNGPEQRDNVVIRMRPERWRTVDYGKAPRG